MCVCVCVHCEMHVPMHTMSNVFGLFVHTIDRHKKGKKEYAVHYVKEGPKVDTTCKEALATEPEYVAGDCIATLCVLLINVCSHD